MDRIEKLEELRRELTFSLDEFGSKKRYFLRSSEPLDGSEDVEVNNVDLPGSPSSTLTDPYSCLLMTRRRRTRLHPIDIFSTVMSISII